jgi:hypothetical protein
MTEFYEIVSRQKRPETILFLIDNQLLPAHGERAIPDGKREKNGYQLKF